MGQAGSEGLRDVCQDRAIPGHRDDRPARRALNLRRPGAMPRKGEKIPRCRRDASVANVRLGCDAAEDDFSCNGAVCEVRNAAFSSDRNNASELLTEAAAVSGIYALAQ